VKYEYLYQTKTNENRRGEIVARNRAEAYFLLRKQGIRPYRVIGDDPVRWQPWAIGAAGALLAAIAATALVIAFSGSGSAAARQNRRQIGGDSSLVVKGFADGWQDAFGEKLYRHFAMYVQPGWDVVPADFTKEQIEEFKGELSRPVVTLRKGVPEYEELAGMVAAMREDALSHIAAGGTLEDYLSMLDGRQELESALRSKAHESLVKAGPSLRHTMWSSINQRLESLGMKPLDEELDSGEERQ
jgi:hypothetical protein